MKYNPKVLLPFLVILGGCAPAVAGEVAYSQMPSRPGEPSKVTAAKGVARRGLVPAERGRTAAVLGVPVRGAAGASVEARSIEPGPLVEGVLREANAARRQHGSGILVVDAALTRAAGAYARELAGRGEIEHLSPTPGRRTFRDRIEAAGARARLGGENLARLTSSPALLPERTVGAWLRSPGHRVNLLDPLFSRTGIGVWLGGDGVWYVVQVYATGS
jgi:uncharacterized protein YkwD